MFFCSGLTCVYLKGQGVPPIMLAMLYEMLRSVNDRLWTLLHKSREIREKLVSLQKLLKLEDIP